MTDLPQPEGGSFFLMALSESISAADTNVGVFSQKQGKYCNGRESTSLL